MTVLLSFVIAAAAVIPLMRWWVRNAPLDTELWAGGADADPEVRMLEELWDRS